MLKYSATWQNLQTDCRLPIPSTSFTPGWTIEISTVFKPLKNNVNASPKSHRHGRPAGFERIPKELLDMILADLPHVSRAALSLCSKHMYKMIGSKPMNDLRCRLRSYWKYQRQQMLEMLERDNGNLFICKSCSSLHQFRYTKAKKKPKCLLVINKGSKPLKNQPMETKPKGRVDVLQNHQPMPGKHICPSTSSKSMFWTSVFGRPNALRWEVVVIACLIPALVLIFDFGFTIVMKEKTPSDLNEVVERGCRISMEGRLLICTN